MLGPILQSVARAAGPSLGRIFAQRAVEAAATAAATAAVGGAIYAGKKRHENSRKGKDQCDKCGREFRGALGADMYCPGCGKRHHLT